MYKVVMMGAVSFWAMTVLAGCAGTANCGCGGNVVVEGGGCPGDGGSGGASGSGGSGGTGCGGTSEECVSWIEIPTSGVVTPVAGDPPDTVLLVRFGPYDSPRTIREIRIVVPLETCSIPTTLAVGAWASEAALPDGDPNTHLVPVDVTSEYDGRALVTLPDDVQIPAGSFGWIARALDDACNATANAEIAGFESLLWRPDGSGWQAVNGQALMSPVDCH